MSRPLSDHARDAWLRYGGGKPYRPAPPKHVVQHCQTLCDRTFCLLATCPAGHKSAGCSLRSPLHNDPAIVTVLLGHKVQLCESILISNNRLRRHSEGPQHGQRSASNGASMWAAGFDNSRICISRLCCLVLLANVVQLCRCLRDWTLQTKVQARGLRHAMAAALASLNYVASYSLRTWSSFAGTRVTGQQLFSMTKLNAHG
mmetsp:Transcript_19671/g.58346  ORF Transcript_19671/g.58346 Transcript_19671/m.58346 type:complete len:202 (+) Transcript_19671:791-1396(+)|eukprot:360487-Chlamydomonas_euryale.AAC.1